jgi:hypothetical protein
VIEKLSRHTVGGGRGEEKEIGTKLNRGGLNEPTSQLKQKQEEEEEEKKQEEEEEEHKYVLVGNPNVHFAAMEERRHTFQVKSKIKVF